MKKDILRKVVSNILLLVISTVMVLGFFYHAEFYQFGLVPLLIVGGVVVFVVLKIIGWANSEIGAKARGRVGNLLFPAKAIPSVLYGEVTSTVRPLKMSRLRVGTLCNVRASVKGRQAGTVLITDIRRKRLKDLTDRDTKGEGVTARDLRRDWKKSYKGGDGDDQMVRIIEFKGTG